MGFDCVATTHVGCRRKLNEDAILVRTERGLWAIADGMGGHDAGEVASAMVVEALATCGGNLPAHDCAAEAIARLDRVNASLVEMARSVAEGGTIGSTVVGLVADDSDYVCFWAGDSRAYRVRDGAIVQLTHDHSMVQDLVDAGMIDPAEAANHPDANVITNAVGAADFLRVDSVDGKLQAGDIFLLASDGLTRLVPEDELLLILLRTEFEQSAEQLLELGLQRGAPDNLSVIVVRIPISE